MVNLRKKGQAVTLKAIGAIFVLFVVGGLIGTYGVDIAEGVGDDFAEGETQVGGCSSYLDGVNCTAAGYNLTQNVVNSGLNFSGQLGNVGTVLGAALIITVLAGAFIFMFKGRLSVQ